MTRYQAYQGNQVEGAGPLGLVLLTYEALYKSLGRARLAIESGDMQAEADHTGRAMEALVELSTSLNMEQGADIARDLASLYVYMMNRVTDGLCSGSTAHIDEVISLVQELRSAWMQLQHNQQGRAAPQPAMQQPARSQLQAVAA